MKMTLRTIASCLAVLLAAMVLTVPGAQADLALSYTGVVVAGETLPISALFGGKVASIPVRAGDLVKKGDVIAEIATTLNYAPLEGTITGIYAAEGDVAESIGERYGAVLYIEPTNRYTIAATTEKAYNSSENKYVHLGEEVYLNCTSDGTHRGMGIVSALTESGYNVEVTGGDFYMGETVNICRDSSYSSQSRIGRGTVGRTTPVAVKGTGSILKLHVENGDFVERGELLFETVDGILDGLYAPDCVVTSPLTGIISTVDASAGGAVGKGDSLAKIHPSDSMQIEISVPEEDLTVLHEGQAVDIEFYWDIDEIKTYSGVVSSISHLSEEGESGLRADKTYYKAYVDFTPDENIRLGMSVIVYPSEQGDQADSTGND